MQCADEGAPRTDARKRERWQRRRRRFPSPEERNRRCPWDGWAAAAAVRGPAEVGGVSPGGGPPRGGMETLRGGPFFFLHVMSR